MNDQQKSRWLIAAVLFIGFVLAFFVDLTGVALHQILGVVVGAIAIYHLLDHTEWVETISRRFLTKMAGRTRLYFMIDAGLLLGFLVMLTTGLGIST